MAERVLTERELNRALLARQLLLERAKTPIPRALERIGGIQAQYAPSMYIGLWSRLEGFTREQLTRALERRTVVQGTMMRATIHLVSRADYWPLTLAIRASRTAWWQRVHPNADPKAMKAAARGLRRFLADGPRKRKEVEELLGRDAALGVGTYVDILRIPPSGTWEQRRADLYGLAEAWIGPPETSAQDGLDHLVRRYLAGFGPARHAEIADFGGVSIAAVKRALDRLELRRFRDEQGKELVDLPRMPLPDVATRAPPRFLPVWDATLLVHARRTQILPEEYRPRIFNTKTPHSVNTFLLDGQVAGTWRFEHGKVRLDAFDGIPRKHKSELDDEARRLAAFHA